MIGPFKFDMFTAAMFIFLCEISKYLQARSISFDGLAYLDWYFMEVDRHTY